jgi:hypothetical protein
LKETHEKEKKQVKKDEFNSYFNFLLVQALCVSQKIFLLFSEMNNGYYTMGD